MMTMMNDEQESPRPRPRPRRPVQPQQQASSRCLLLLQQSLAIQLARGPPHSPGRDREAAAAAAGEHPADEMWMYDKGYNLFQGFLEANSRCWWNVALVEATRQIRYKGHCAPGVLMVGGPACALEVLRAAWARNVLRPPADHVITCLGDIEDCLVAPVAQGQFTPLPEALCCAILELSTQRQAATLDTLRGALRAGFPGMQRPSRDMVYDALAKLMQERKIYHTAQGYFVVTPEARRLRRHESRSARASRGPGGPLAGMLLSSDEAVALVHGEMLTVRDGDVTHQAVQTNLADVICGGNPNDKVLFARCRSVPSRLERRHSLRLWGSARRLHRSGSSRSLPRRPERSDTSSSAEYASTDSAPHSPTKKIGLLSRLFRRSARRGAKGSGPGSALVGTFSAQYPPREWFNPRVVHLHSVATQTRPASPARLLRLAECAAASQPQSQSRASLERAWDDGADSVRSATLPRRQHRRQPSLDSESLLANSTPRSSRRQRSPCSTLPLRSKCSSLSRCTSRTSVLPANSSGGASNGTSNHHHNNASSNSSPSRSANSPRPPTGNASPAKTASLSSNGSSLGRAQSGGRANNGPAQHKVLQKSASSHSSQSSSGKSTSSGRLSALSSPLKLTPQQQQQQPLPLTPLQEAAARNSITLQVSTKLSPGAQFPATTPLPSVHSSVTLASSASSTTTISGSPGTKIYVQQTNSPVRSVITFENQPAAVAKQQRAERPSSLQADDKENVRLRACGNKGLNNSGEAGNGEAEAALNNARKLSLSKDALSYRNLLRQQPSKNNASNPPSPTKCCHEALGGSAGNVLYIENLDKQPGSQPSLLLAPLDALHKPAVLSSYPSLSDMHCTFTSLAAQKILKGCPLNSVDTLVEVNMASAADSAAATATATTTATANASNNNDKPNNCDLTVHTDFGLV